MPAFVLRFGDVGDRLHRTRAPHATDDELRDQDRHNEQQQRSDVDEHERAAAGNASDVGKAPHVAKPYGRADRGEDENDP